MNYTESNALVRSEPSLQHLPMLIPETLIQRLAGVKCATVLTGAGVSAESGVPTFRDAQTGLWAQYRAEDLATPRAFRRNPRLVWEWYQWRRQLVARAEPNPAHLALAEMERLFPKFQLITQNVDGLHQRAGSTRVIELHGSIMRTKCFDEDTVVSSWAETTEVPPKCPRCGGWLRPDVVWFEEAMPEKEMLLAEQASAACELFIAIGTSATVQPAASLPLKALYHGATVVEINPQKTSLTDRAHFSLSGAAGVLIPELVRQIEQVKSQAPGPGADSAGRSPTS